MPKPVPHSSYPEDIRWIFNGGESTVTAVCARCGMKLGTFWSARPAGIPMRIPFDFVEQHARRCLALPTGTGLDFGVGAP